LKSTIIKSNRCPKYGIASKKAKRALSTNIVVSRNRCLHIDDKYGIDVDELYNQYLDSQLKELYTLKSVNQRKLCKDVLLVFEIK
jgi:hypothetical protein